jgi:peptidoglycan hydrolase-like protein with peptidoglycan-binding domain
MAEGHRIKEGKRVIKKRRRGALEMPEASLDHVTFNGFTGIRQQVGNRALNRLLDKSRKARRPFSQASPFYLLRQALLNAAQETSAIGYNSVRYDSRSARIIQIVSGTPVDGAFSKDTVQSVASYQQAHPPLVVDGKVGPNTLNVMVPDRTAANFHEHAIQLVADFYNLNVTSDTLSVHFDAGLATPFDTSFQSGNLRVIRIGSSGITDADTLRDTIQAGLDVPAPPAVIFGERPTHLTTAQEKAATLFNRSRFQDPRSVKAIQGLVGTEYDAAFGPDTAERIAEFQSTSGLDMDGKVNEDTLAEMVTLLDLIGEQDSAIRMIIDFYDMSEFGSLLDIFFDPTVTANAVTEAAVPGPSIIRIGPKAFAPGFAGLVHTIAHELEHVRQNREGLTSVAVAEFLGERVEILSRGMREEAAAGVMSDARRALANWNNMTVDEQRENWDAFVEVRDKVRERFNDFSTAEQGAHQATMDAYDAVTEPAAAGP